MSFAKKKDQAQQFKSAKDMELKIGLLSKIISYRLVLKVRIPKMYDNVRFLVTF